MSEEKERFEEGKFQKKVDEAWKAQAAREKEELQQSTAGVADRKEGQSAPLPEASFSTLVLMLRAQTLVALGLADDPVTGRRQPDRNQAKYLIDTLGVLEEKTKGNLTEEEKSLLDAVLFELRTGFVKM